MSLLARYPHLRRHLKVQIANAFLRASGRLYRIGYYLSGWAFDEDEEDAEYREKAYCRARPAPLEGECQFDLASGQCLHCRRKAGEPHATEKSA